MKFPCYIPVGRGMVYMAKRDGSAKMLKVGSDFDGSPMWMYDVLTQPRSFIREALHQVLNNPGVDYTVLPKPKFPLVKDRRKEAGS